MLADEIDGALRDVRSPFPPLFIFLYPPLILEMMQGERYRFSHLLFMSRAYHLSEEALLANSAHPSTRRQPKSKKMRPATSQQQQERPCDRVYWFHPENDLVSSSLCTFLWKPPDADATKRYPRTR
jgi:protein BCP1